MEGDLIIGERNRSALITLVERVTRTHLVLDLPGGHRSAPTCERLDVWVATMPANELRSITWDRGSEMADWSWWQSANQAYAAHTAHWTWNSPFPPVKEDRGAEFHAWFAWSNKVYEGFQGLRGPSAT